MPEKQEDAGGYAAMRDDLGRRAYAVICAHDGILARDVARKLGVERADINRCFYRYPFIRDLCYHDDAYYWHGYIQHGMPHAGLADYCGWYGLVNEFESTDPDTWLDELLDGCRAIGRNLNDTRGLFHSFRDTRDTIEALVDDLRACRVDCGSWELAFELRIKRAKWVRIYADVLVVTPTHAFALEFKMKDVVDPGEVVQAAKYAPYLEVVLGPRHEVVPALVLTRATDLFEHAVVPGDTGEVAVASGDMLFNVFDEYLGFLEE